MRTQEQKFTVGGGATIHVGSDSYPATIDSIRYADDGETPITIYVRRDRAHRARGTSEAKGNERYLFTPNQHAPIVTYTRRKDGRYVERGCSMRHGRTLAPGRSQYMDPSF